MEKIAVLLIAVSLDLAFGEPPNAWHPVAWLGKLISFLTKFSPDKGKFRQMAYGAAIVLITLGLIVTAVYFLLAQLSELNLLTYIIFSAILLKFSFSLRGLRQAVDSVKKCLTKDNLEQARLSLRSLVSRDTAELSQGQVISAAVESAAENICDSFVAPLLYFFILGIPGAIAYRIINTFDTMVGYHGRWEHVGKFAARFDDVTSFIPARLTALIIVLSALICRRNISQAWHIMIRDHNKTESPNAGWTMSAIAGALEIQLEKVGHYRLGDNNLPLTLDTINDSRHIIMAVATIWCSIFVLAEVIYLVAT
jgi:adenosylcobinamide-phosphate synthase